MERHATQKGSGNAGIHAPSFQAVFDSRKRKVPGLWLRGSRYYAQLRVDLGNGRTAPRRIALTAENLDQAKAELERTRTERRAGTLPTTGHRPKFDDFAREYFASAAFAQKKTSTQGIERQALNRWIAHLGGIRLDKITAPMIHAYREQRLALGRMARTVNLDTVAVRNVLKLARDRGHIERLPETRQLKQKPAPRRPLVTGEQFAVLLRACRRGVTKNAALFRLYLRFLALTGSREKEALAVRWGDVDFTRETVTIGSGGTAKNHKSRDVDFSPELKLLLSEMNAGRPPDSTWLFPSPQRGERDTPAKGLRESLNLVRKKAGMPGFGFHDLRHFFASQCVMAGIDFMTIAHWLGHSDGGILVGKVYGHLADTHKKAAAQKLTFFTRSNSNSQPSGTAIAEGQTVPLTE
ncbi:MAG: site-specific integrase [Chthoniobacter sp.]|nr:site-specific integrase [Chthoniobacter sp.]